MITKGFNNIFTTLLMSLCICVNFAFINDSADITVNDAMYVQSSNLTWYALRSGDWTDWETWTLAPSGNLPNNPGNTIPGLNDQVVIHSGKTVKIYQADGVQECSRLTVEGRLDLSESNEINEFGEIRGGGRIILANDNFPNGNASHFNSSSGEGTVVYVGDSFNLNTSTSQSTTYYNMEVKLTDSNQVLTVVRNFTLLNSLVVSSGQFKINDDVSTAALEINITRDVRISAGAKITVGRGNTVGAYSIASNNLPSAGGYHKMHHRLKIGGSLHNQGELLLSNRTHPIYNEIADDGAVVLEFNAENDAEVLLEGPSKLYSLIINKGNDKTYQLEIDAVNEDYFTLLGPNSLGRLTSAPFTTTAPEVRKALWIQNGTLKLSGNLHIPSLSEGNLGSGNGDFAIGHSGRLWIASADTKVYTTATANNQIPGSLAEGINTGGGHQAISVYGELLISDGLLNTRNSAGVIFWGEANGQLKIQGGTLEAGQIRSQSGASGVVSYIQSSGEVILWGSQQGAAIGTNYPLFGLDSESSVFHMSGGSITIKDAHNGSVPDFRILSSEGNYQVTGGSLNIELDDANSFDYHSTVPVYDLTIKRYDADNVNVNASMTNAFELKTELTVLRDLVLETPDDVSATSKEVVRFLHNGNDLTIGRNFTIERGALYQWKDYSNKTWNYADDTKNTTTFNSNQDGQLYYTWYSDKDAHQEQFFWNLVIDKSEGAKLTLASDDARYKTNHSYNSLFRTHGELRVEQGTLDQDYWVGRAMGSIVNKGVLFTYDHDLAQSDNRYHRAYLEINTQEANIETTDGAEFGHIKMTSNNGVISFSSDVYIKRLLYKLGGRGGSINIGTHQLKLDYFFQYSSSSGNNTTLLSSSNFNSSNMIYSTGTASDGGLKLKVDASQDYIFPIGCNGKYTPATVTVNNSDVSDGYITIIPVDKELQTTNLSGGDCLSYYWKVEKEGFEGQLPNINLSLIYDTNDVSGSANNYVAGQVLNEGLFERWYENSPNPDYGSVIENSKKIVFNGSTDQGFEIENANYTAGEEDRFIGSPEIFYLNTSGGTNLWTNISSWAMDRDGTVPANDYPKDGDVAIIQRQGANYSGLVTLNSTINVGSVIIDDQHGFAGGSPRIIFSRDNNYAAYSSVLNSVEVADTHAGTSSDAYAAVMEFKIDENYNGELPGGDFEGFNNYENALVVYAWEGASSNADVTLSDSFAEYPSLWFSGGNNDRIIRLPDADIKVNGNLVVPHKVKLVTGEGQLDVMGNVILGHFSYHHGRLLFPVGNNEASIVKVYGNLLLRNKSSNTTASLVGLETPGHGQLEHQLNIYGNIQVESEHCKLQLGSETTSSHINLSLLGEGNHHYSSVSPTITNFTFSNVIIDKGGAQDHSFSFNSPFMLSGETSGLRAEKAFKLESGSVIFNNPSINLALNTGGDDFRIPGAAALIVEAGTLSFYGDDCGIYLDGQLKVSSAPSADPNQPNLGVILLNGNMAGMFGDARGNDNNYIEYSSSGNAELIIDGGMLRVGSQIRRPVNTEEGILKFTQSSSSGLVVGEFAAPVNNRGVFEILNEGSSFTQTEGDLLIYNSQDSPTFPSFYFDPETSNINDDTNITIGQQTYVDNLTHQFDLYIKEPIKNLCVLGENTVAKLVTVPLTSSNLTIGTLDGTTPVGATLNANGLDITLSGDFLNYGTFYANENTCSFSGTTSQIISGTSQTSFSTLTKDENNTLSLDVDITIDDYLKVTDGILSDNGHNINLKGNVLNTAEINHVAGADGLVFNGTEQQIIEGNGGLYGKLYIDNWDDNSVSGVKLTTNTDSIIIQNNLSLKAGIFDIGENLLVMTADAVFTPVNAYATNNMVITNASFTDSGIKKYFNQGSASNFIYPIGSGGKYTPVLANITSINGNASAIIVKAANEMHPSIQEDNESPDYEIVDQQNALNFYWSLKGNSITNFSGNIDMFYDGGDVLVSNQNGSSYDVSDYIPARLVYNQSAWNKFDWTDFDEDNGYMRFTYTGVSGNEISGDYTAGVQPNTQTGNGAIPDNVPAYESISSGLWSDASSWQTVPSGGIVPTGGPRGAQVIINADHTIRVEQGYKSSYRTSIKGKLNMGTTFGNRLGIVEGTGTLISESEILPAGFYENFFSNEGGTLEYSGNASYDILNNISDINHLKLSGTGERRLPNVNLNLKGDLTIEGDNTNLLYVNEHNRNLVIKGDITFEDGVADWGQQVGNRNPYVELSGSEIQYVKGQASFTGVSAFNDLYINNANGVIVQTAIDVNSKMQLQSGIVETSANVKLTLLNNNADALTGGGATTYINGPLRKMMQSSQVFTFPIGQSATYSPMQIATDQNSSGIWEVEYYKSSPANHSRVMDVESIESPLEYISHQEFWRVLGPNATAKSVMTFKWGNHSGVDKETLRMGVWIPFYLGDVWRELLCNDPIGTNASGSIAIRNARSAFDFQGEGSYFTFASSTILADSWLGTISNDWFTAGNWTSNAVPVVNSDVTINEGATYNAHLDGDAQINDLNIVSGNLTVKPGSHFTINGELIGIDKGLIIESTNEKVSSVIAKSSVAPLVSYKWILPELRYWYIGVPLSGVKMSHFTQSLTTNGNAYVVYQYLNSWQSVGNSSYLFYDKDDVSNTGSALEGYSLNIKDAGSTLVYEGHLNTADSYLRSFEKEGWYLIGNPYSCYLDVKEGIELGSFEKTVWVRTELGVDSRGFATYNIQSGLGQNGGTKYIVPGQSFWLRTYVENDSVMINKAGQLHSQTAMKLKSAGKTDVIRLELNQKGTKDELVLALRPEGSFNVTKYDSEKRMGDKYAVNLFAKKEGQALSINVLPELTDSLTIPLEYKIDLSKGGTLELNALNINEWPNDWHVALHDRLTKMQVDLKNQSSYEFEATNEESQHLELIIYKEQVATDISGKKVEQQENVVYINGVDDRIDIVIDKVFAPSVNEYRCEIYDMTGRLIYKHNLTESSHQIHLDGTQILLVKVFIGNECFIKKVAI